jgi:hypothetical protein
VDVDGDVRERHEEILMGPFDRPKPPDGVQERADQLGRCVGTREERFDVFASPGRHEPFHDRLNLAASHRTSPIYQIPT